MTESKTSANPPQGDLEAVAERVRKLLAVAGKAGTEAEAAAFMAKAEELLLAHNLSMAAVEQGAGGSGRREDARVRGGVYTYERDLWGSVAALNFCIYFSTRNYEVVGKRRQERWERETGLEARDRRRWVFRHRLVGRVSNVQATRVMAEYLQDIIERLCRERLATRAGDGATSGELNSQFFSSWAVSYREGIAERVTEKLAERRRHLLRDEQRRAVDARKAAVAAGRGEASTATALSVEVLTKTEHDANIDFIYGEGTSAEWAAHRAEAARAAEEADREYARWAQANPKEAAREAARERANARRRVGGRIRGPTDSERRRWSGGYAEGYEVGDRVSLDQQVDTGSAKRIGRGS